MKTAKANENTESTILHLLTRCEEGDFDVKATSIRLSAAEKKAIRDLFVFWKMNS